MARQLTKASFGAPSAEATVTIETEEKVTALREANFRYKTKRRDIEDKFGAALAALREAYLSEVMSC